MSPAHAPRWWKNCSTRSDALEQGDEAGWRRELDAIAAWRTQPMMQGLGRLARELAQTLGELPPHRPGELDDACARLDHVVEMTEQASHTTLDLAEQCRGYATQLKGTALSPEQAALVDSIGKGLSEMALAQSYQDLTGQIIRRVAGIVRRVHEGFGALGLPPPEKKNPSIWPVRPLLVWTATRFHRTTPTTCSPDWGCRHPRTRSGTGDLPCPMLPPAVPAIPSSCCSWDRCWSAMSWLAASCGVATRTPCTCSIPPADPPSRYLPRPCPPSLLKSPPTS